MTKDEALFLAFEALEEIALAGMSGSGQESDAGMTAWHARQAWKFIGISARALEPIKETLAQQEQGEPPQRTWVGLTNEERDEICLGDESIARAIEAKLKEKNHG